MREIIFRSWFNNQMFNVSSYSIGGLVQLVGDGTPRLGLPVMQYIGLKDLNGVKIFEGDIVKNFNLWPGNDFKGCPKTAKMEDICKFVNPEKRIVEFVSDIDRCGFSKHLYHWFKTWSIDGSNHAGGNIVEVIGNIYENPELLK